MVMKGSGGGGEVEMGFGGIGTVRMVATMGRTLRFNGEGVIMAHLRCC